MLSIRNITGLSEGEKETVEKAETFIDQTIADAHAKDDRQRRFTITHADIAKSAGVDALSLASKRALIKRYVKGKWEVCENQHALILTAPERKRGGRPKGSGKKTAQVAQPAATPVTAPPPVAPVESAPAESPAQPASV
jgi:hypothetical protein